MADPQGTDQQHKLTVETVILAGISALLHQTGIFLMFFAVPVQVLAVKRGFRAFLNGTMISLGAIALWKGFQIAGLRSPDADPLLIMLDLLLPAAIFVGLGIVNYGFRGQGTDAEWRRLTVGGVVAAAIVVPLLIYTQQSPLFLAVVEAQHSFLVEQGMLEEITMPELREQLMMLLLRGVGGAVMAIMAISYYFGTIAAGVRGQIARLALPRSAALLLAAAILGILLDLNAAVSIAAWNTAMILAILFSIVGVSMIGDLLSRKLGNKRSRLLMTAALLVILFVPLVNIVVLIALPVAGVVETVAQIRERYLFGIRSDG